MASAMRDSGRHLELREQLSENPWQFGFYQAVRQIECLHRELPRTGFSRLPRQDALRLCQTPSLKFAPSTISDFRIDEAGNQRLEVYFLGLLGPNGPLPLHISEYVHSRLRHGDDPVIAEFLNLFHHRVLSLFYRAWAAKEPTVQFDRPESDRFRMYVGALSGYGTSAYDERDAMPDLTKLHFSALLGCHTRHADGLISILSTFFQLPVRVQEFIGEWLTMPEDQCCYLGTNTAATQLGVLSVIGRRSWQCQHKIRVQFGPLDLETYKTMLPRSTNLQRLSAILKNYLGVELVWELNLVLAKDEIPDARLGRYGQLGWTTWLGKSNRTTDADEFLMNSEDLMAA